MEEKRFCRKCFLADLDNEKLLADVKAAIERIDEKDRLTGERYDARLSVCRECKFLEEATCKACGCYVELRAASLSSKCPYNKWQSNSRGITRQR